jgi:phosphohistidine phosphatase SixA
VCWLSIGLPAANALPEIVILVRHAEKSSAPENDPRLSAAGRARAKLLASMLSYAGISAIYSSEFLRTRQTAQPASDRLHVRVTVVPGGDAARLKQLIVQQSGKAVLVVGHSNTIPALIADLNGPSDVAIAETDYDRLFVLSPQSSGKSSLLTLRYGAATPGQQAASNPNAVTRILVRRSGGIAANVPGSAVSWTIDLKPGETARTRMTRGRDSQEFQSEEIDRLARKLNANALRQLSGVDTPRGADQMTYDVTVQGPAGAPRSVRIVGSEAAKVSRRVPELGALLEALERLRAP